ncbi:signal peptidase I [Dehalobacter sp. DCM]|uniref:signal peptidase I n=1 Tax=Dehalobacter sp. DCM TaxID=2907827 RepID=UPI0030821EE9|nr:signal peptidase I [Dehalobacter sp. DCM]
MNSPQKIGLKKLGLKSRWKMPPTLRLLREIVEIFLIVFALSWVIKTYLLGFATTTDQSMLPTLNDQNHLVVEKWINKHIASLETGNIIVFTYGNATAAKRVIGLPGDKVEIKSGYTFINGQPIYEPYANTPATYTFLPVIVPQGAVFVINDDRTDPLDSRHYGFIYEKDIVGRAFVCFWPLSYMKTL